MRCASAPAQREQSKESRESRDCSCIGETDTRTFLAHPATPRRCVLPREHQRLASQQQVQARHGKIWQDRQHESASWYAWFNQIVCKHYHTCIPHHQSSSAWRLDDGTRQPPQSLCCFRCHCDSGSGSGSGTRIGNRAVGDAESLLLYASKYSGYTRAPLKTTSSRKRRRYPPSSTSSE
jgi:hypothetical protein